MTKRESRNARRRSVGMVRRGDLTASDVARMGGKALAASRTPEERSAAARKAGLANADRIARLRAELDGYRANSAKQGGDGQ